MLRLRYLATYFRSWFGVIWALVGGLFLLIWLLVARADADLVAHGVVAEARVVEKGKETSVRGGTSCWLRYTWRDARGVEQVGLATLPWLQWRNFDDGAQLRVRYLPDDPSRSALLVDEGDAARLGCMLGLGIGLVVTAFGGALVATALRASGRRVSLLRSGTRASGTVAALELIQNLRVNRRNPVFLRVDYKDELGRAHQAASACLPSALRERWAPGDPIGVVYDAFDPARGEVDIFEARSA